MRYSAQRFGTWEWLDFEVPFDTDGPEWARSAAGVMEAVIAPEIGLLVAEDGRPVLEEWGTFIHCESDEGAITVRHWTGIVTKSELEGKEWVVTIEEFPAYLVGQPVESLIRGVNTDPADLIRKLWQDKQLMPNSWHGVTVTGSTPVRVGSSSDDEVARARAAMDARKETLDALNKSKNNTAKELQDNSSTLADEVDQARKDLSVAQGVVAQLVKDKATSEEIASAMTTVKARETTLKTLQASYKTETEWRRLALVNARKTKEGAQQSYDRAKEVYEAAKDKARDDGGAYEIRPEDTPDAMQALSNLCDTAELEWTTRTAYSSGAPKLEVVVHHPRAGRDRSDLVFEQGVNVMEQIKLTRGEDYANASVGVGAGEGKESVRGSIPSTSNKMRRITVFTDQTIKKQTELLAAMRKDLKKRSGDPYVSDIVVVDHELTPMFSWNVGDTITVAGDVPHYGYYTRKHRIVSWQMLGDKKAKLFLELAV